MGFTLITLFIKLLLLLNSILSVKKFNAKLIFGSDLLNYRKRIILLFTEINELRLKSKFLSFIYFLLLAFTNDCKRGLRVIYYIL